MDNQTTETKTQKIAYWPNGLWFDDLETVQLAVELGEFPDTYKVVEFPADADPALIDKEVLLLVEGR